MDTEKRLKRAETAILYLAVLVAVFIVSVIICVFKYREVADDYAKLATNYKRLEYRQVKIINQTEDIINVEPSDDEIIITVGQDIFKKGGD